MRGVNLFIFIVAVPALAALGHDIYLFYIDNGVNMIAADINAAIEEKGPLSFFATLGYIWTQYHPESYKWIVENSNQGIWDIINMLLAQKAVFIGLAFAGLNYFILLLLKLFGAWPFAGEKSSNLSGKKGDKMKYNRK